MLGWVATLTNLAAFSCRLALYYTHRIKVVHLFLRTPANSQKPQDGITQDRFRPLPFMGCQRWRQRRCGVRCALALHAVMVGGHRRVIGVAGHRWFLVGHIACMFQLSVEIFFVRPYDKLLLIEELTRWARLSFVTKHWISIAISF